MSMVGEYFLGCSMADDAADLFDAAGPVRFYGSRFVARNGVTVHSDFLNKKQEHCLVNIPGSAFDVLPGGGCDALCSFLGHLLTLEDPSESECVPVLVRDDDGVSADDVDVPIGRVFKVTRLDLAFDGVLFTVAQCVAAAESGNVRSSVNKGRAIRSLGDRVAGEDGDTFEWGRRASKSRMVRAYDRRGFVRFEMEWRGDRSDLLARELGALGVQAWASRAIGHLRAFLDFVDADASLNISRCPLLSWWAEFVQGVEKIRIPIRRVQSPLVARVHSQVKRVQRGLARLNLALGPVWLMHHCVRMGEFKLTPADHRQVAELREVRVHDPYALGCEGALGSLATAVDAVVGYVAPTLAQFRLTF
jgi:hypothetical protein